MKTQFYGYEFSPFTIDGDRRIVASEDEWRRVRAFARKNGAARIRVPVDVFEPWTGPMVDVAGWHLWANENNELEVQLMPGRTDFLFYQHKYKPLRMSDVRRRTFGLIDDFPNVTWMLETERPENVAAMWPSADIFEGQTGDDKPVFWPNLWLYARADSQAEADSRIPHLLQCPAAVRGLVMEPREDVELCNVSGWKDKAYWWGRTIMGGDGINHVIIRGGAEPMHPDWVRSIIRQCEAAGVPVWFDGWGEWISAGVGWVDSLPKHPRSELPGNMFFPPLASIQCIKVGGMDFARVGAAHSGRVIDGCEVNQLPEATS